MDAFSPMHMRAHCEDKRDDKREIANKEQNSKQKRKIAIKKLG